MRSPKSESEVEVRSAECGVRSAECGRSAAGVSPECGAAAVRRGCDVRSGARQGKVAVMARFKSPSGKKGAGHLSRAAARTVIIRRSLVARLASGGARDPQKADWHATQDVGSTEQRRRHRTRRARVCRRHRREQRRSTGTRKRHRAWIRKRQRRSRTRCAGDAGAAGQQKTPSRGTPSPAEDCSGRADTEGTESTERKGSESTEGAQCARRPRECTDAARASRVEAGGDAAAHSDGRVRGAAVLEDRRARRCLQCAQPRARTSRP